MPAKTQCYGCDKKFDKGEKYCVFCTYNNFRANGFAVSIRDCLSLSAPEILKNPQYIVYTVKQ